jgi:haloacetate dehalogenase
LDIWVDWADNVEGRGVAGGHLIAETADEGMLSLLLPFLERTTPASRQR